MARQIASSWEGRVARRLREKVEMLFAHLKRILKLDRLRLRGPNGARDEFLLAATAQNCVSMLPILHAPKAANAGWCSLREPIYLACPGIAAEGRREPA